MGVSLNFHVKETSPTNHFCTNRQANECLTTLSLTVFTQRNFVADFAILHRKQPFCIFQRPFGALGATYNVHLELSGECIVDLLLVLIELFSLRVTAKAL